MPPLVLFSVDIDPILTGAGGIVRGTTVTVTGSALYRTSLTRNNRTRARLESIHEVAVRLGSPGRS